MGLIGSSLARVIRKNKIAERIVAIDQDAEVCNTVHKLGLADEITQSVVEGVKDSDFVLIAIPVRSIPRVIEKCLPHLMPEAVLTDAGSVKGPVFEKVKNLGKRGAQIIPGHPVAGTENSGPESGFAELFENRWCILTPHENASIGAIEKVTAFWEASGSKVEIMDVSHHDKILGITSHLPHMIAFAIVNTANNLREDLRREVMQYSASGFRDFTRIASENPDMWLDIFLDNKTEILDVLQRFKSDLSLLENALLEEDGKTLWNIMNDSRKIREGLIALGQHL